MLAACQDIYVVLDCEDALAFGSLLVVIQILGSC